MSDYSTLKSTIQSVVKQNGQNEITGNLLQQCLVAMINTLGAGFQFVGIATPETSPVTPDYRAFYILGPGAYTNFGSSFTIDWNQIGVAKYSTSWDIQTLSLNDLWQYISLGTIKNINMLTGQTAQYYTLTTAVAALGSLGSKYWSGAMLICYRTASTKWEIAQFHYPQATQNYVEDVTSWDVLLNTDSFANIVGQIRENGIFNVNNYVGQPTQQYTLQQAIQLIPLSERRPQMFICFRYSDYGFYLAQYIAASVADEYFYDTTRWHYGDIDKLKRNQAATVFNVNEYENDPTAGYTLQQAIQRVPAISRFIGMIVVFREHLTRVRMFQYFVGSIDDTNFYNLNNWNEIPNGSYIGTRQIISSNDQNIEDNYAFSNYYRVQSGLRISVFHGSSVPGIVFYDRNFDFVSAVDDPAILPLLVITTVVLGSDVAIPSGAYYFRFVASMEMRMTLEMESIDVNAISAWQNQELQPFTHLMGRNYMYSLSSAQIGDVISLTPTTNAQANCICLKCNAGDTFYINGQGGNGPRLWAFLDNDRKLLSLAANAETYTGKKVAESDGYFIFQVVRSYLENFYIYRQNQSINRKIVDVEPAEWIALGDSISQGYYSDDVEPYYHLDPTKGWTNWVRLITGKTLDNQSVGGTGYACKGPQGTSPSGRELVDTLISAGRFTGKKLVTLAYGVNDWKYNYTLGSMDDPVSSSATNIIPSMRYVIERILQANPTIKIVVIMPINCKFGNETNNWGIGYTFSNNGTLEQIFEAFKTVCEYYGIEYIDMLHASVVNRKNIGALLLDSVHPSIPAHELMGRELAQKINCY